MAGISTWMEPCLAYACGVCARCTIAMDLGRHPTESARTSLSLTFAVRRRAQTGLAKPAPLWPKPKPGSASWSASRSPFSHPRYASLSAFWYLPPQFSPEPEVFSTSNPIQRFSCRFPLSLDPGSPRAAVLHQQCFAAVLPDWQRPPIEIVDKALECHLKRPLLLQELILRDVRSKPPKNRAATGCPRSLHPAC